MHDPKISPVQFTPEKYVFVLCLSPFFIRYKLLFYSRVPYIEIFVSNCGVITMSKPTDTLLLWVSRRLHKKKLVPGSSRYIPAF